jgi:hypothetical protein
MVERLKIFLDTLRRRLTRQQEEVSMDEQNERLAEDGDDPLHATLTYAEEPPERDTPAREPVHPEVIPDEPEA